MRKTLEARTEYQREYRQRKAAEKKAAKPPSFCKCGCGATAVYPFKYTTQCREAATARIYQAYLDRVKEERAAITIEAPKPRKKSKPIMTDAQQRKIDAEAAAKDRERLKTLGYGNGPVTIYRGAEVAKVAVTPIHLIPRRDFGVRESGDAFQ